MDSTTTDVHDDLAWAKGLKRSGLYFDGFVDDVECVLEKHRKDTVTFYGTRTSTGGVAEKENAAPSTDFFISWTGTIIIHATTQSFTLNLTRSFRHT